MTKAEIVKYSNQRIEENSKLYGYKAANLINLQQIIQEFNGTPEATELHKLHGDIELKVPEFCPVDAKIIEAHLNEYAPEWTGQFQAFQNAFNTQLKKDVLEQAAKDYLHELQKTITKCFKDKPLSSEEIGKFLTDSNLSADNLLMVRSTGVHEDRADMANPGGNESLPCRATAAEISAALGVVAASYIGEKSLSQRLGSGDANISEIPVMPGLIQTMVGENVNVQSVISSGVIYTNDGSTRIQAAYGHGEYVVNSKGKVDNYYVSNQDIVYSEIAPKDFRLKPDIQVGRGNAVNLIRQENDNSLKYSPSIDPDSVIYLHKLAKYIEEKYGSRVDIEFVYNPASQPASINIVQARAIPIGSRIGLEPSALSPDFLAKHKDQLSQTINGLQVITPEVNRAAVITNNNQIITAPNIEQALSEYNKLSKENKDKIKSVVVEHPAPDTFHEAGVFNAASVAVLQVKNIETVKNLLPNAETQGHCLETVDKISKGFKEQ